MRLMENHSISLIADTIFYYLDPQGWEISNVNTELEKREVLQNQI